jgi:hypothetical protein
MQINRLTIALLNQNFVEFRKGPYQETFAKVCVFSNIFGNLCSLFNEN